VRLAASTPLRAECRGIRKTKLPGTLWATPGLLRESFTFTKGGGWSTPRPGRFTPGKPGTPCTGGWVGPRANLDEYGKSRLHRDLIPHRPDRSESLYRLSYPGPFKPIYNNGNNKHSFSINTYNIFRASAVLAAAKETVEHHAHNKRDAVCSV
jgi:hypothetical protein